MTDREFFSRQLLYALATNSRQAVFLGELTATIFLQLNSFRLRSGVPIIDTPAIYIYPNVINKIIFKRVQIGHMSIQSVVHVADQAIFLPQAQILPSRFPHIQLLASLKDNNSANCVYIGSYKQAISIKVSASTTSKTLTNRSWRAADNSHRITDGSRSTNFSEPQDRCC